MYSFMPCNCYVVVVAVYQAHSIMFGSSTSSQCTATLYIIMVMPGGATPTHAPGELKLCCPTLRQLMRETGKKKL